MDVDALHTTLLWLHFALLCYVVALYIRNLVWTIPKSKNIEGFRSTFYIVGTLGFLIAALLLYFTYHGNVGFPRELALAIEGWTFLWLMLIRDAMVTIVLLIVAESMKIFCQYFDKTAEIEQKRQGDN